MINIITIAVAQIITKHKSSEKYAVKFNVEL